MVDKAAMRNTDIGRLGENPPEDAVQGTGFVKREAARRGFDIDGRR